MPIVRPFRAIRPAPEHAASVIAPPYDVVTLAEARQRVDGLPHNFLRVSRPDINLPKNTAFNDPLAYRQARQNFNAMRNDGILIQDEAPAFYLYQMQQGEHVQTGLVATVSVDDYESNRIRRHELTRHDKEDDRVRHIDALDAQTGPVLLAYRDQPQAKLVIDACLEKSPVYKNLELDGVRHSLWIIDQPEEIDQITDVWSAIDSFYIADGHHRSAAAARVADARSAKLDQASHYFLAVMFPAQQMQILPYNRLVKDLNGLSVDEFLQKLGQRFHLQLTTRAVEPDIKTSFGMYLAGKWYLLNVMPEFVSAEVVDQLDVSYLAKYCIEPILGINDPRRDQRINFVGGIHGTTALEKAVDTGGYCVAFSLFPTAMSEVMSIADAGKIMPPKSTWFEPKLADGIVVHSVKG